MAITETRTTSPIPEQKAQNLAPHSLETKPPPLETENPKNYLSTRCSLSGWSASTRRHWVCSLHSGAHAGLFLFFHLNKTCFSLTPFVLQTFLGRSGTRRLSDTGNFRNDQGRIARLLEV